MVPFHNAGMDYQRLESLQKCMVAPHLVDLHDIAQMFFEHSSDGSKIEKLQEKSCIIFFAKKMSNFFADVKH